jgi:hypothetical protein
VFFFVFLSCVMLVHDCHVFVAGVRINYVIRSTRAEPSEVSIGKHNVRRIVFTGEQSKFKRYFALLTPC